MGWELEEVEKPFIAQLQKLGWHPIEGNLDDPTVTHRSSFTEVIVGKCTAWATAYPQPRIERSALAGRCEASLKRWRPSPDWAPTN